MKYLKNVILSTTAFGLVFTSTITMAGYKSEIINSCSAYQQGRDNTEINACKLYIDGFIDALIYTQKGAVKPKSVIDGYAKEQSDFEKRVYKTRVSSKINNEIIHKFCISHELDRKAVASIVAKSIGIEQLQNTPLRKVVFATLTGRFPCRNIAKIHTKESYFY